MNAFLGSSFCTLLQSICKGSFWNSHVMYGFLQIVFSSSATVYGQPKMVPCTEEFPLQVMNPYGRTKVSLHYCLNSSCGSFFMSSSQLILFNSSQEWQHADLLFCKQKYSPQYTEPFCFPNDIAAYYWRHVARCLYSRSHMEDCVTPLLQSSRRTS